MSIYPTINALIKMLRGVLPAKTVIRRVRAIGAPTRKHVLPMATRAPAVVQISAQLTMWKAAQRVSLVGIKDPVSGVPIQDDVQPTVIPARAVADRADIKAHRNKPMC